MDLNYKGTRLLVCNYQGCKDFYQNILEFELIYEGASKEEADLQLGDTTLNLIKRESMANIIGSQSTPSPTDEQQDNVAIIFTTRDLDAICDRLKAKEINFITQPMYRPEWGIKTIYLRDPDANLIGIYEMTT